jgi:hypothetical protein
MASTSITVLEEFLRSASSQTRKNSLTALSVIDNEESAKLIATIALQDDDASVRQRAVDEMLSLDQNLRKTVIDVLSQGMSSEDAHQKERAYAILGRLKSQGWDIPKVRMKWGDRLWLATSIYSSAYPQRGWWFRVRSLKPAILATAIATLPCIVSIIFMAVRDQSFASQALYIKVLIIAICIVLPIAILGVIGAVLSVLSTQFASPIYLHLRLLAASIVQVLVTFLCTFLGGFFGLMVLYFLGIFRYTMIEQSEFIIFLLLLGLMAAVIRLGTLLPLGRTRFVQMSRSRKMNWFLETAAGTLGGFSLATVLYLWYMRDASPYDRGPYTAIWLASLAIIVGLANSFAKIDTEVL